MLKSKNKRPVLVACVVGLLIGWAGTNLSEWYAKVRNTDSDGFGPLYRQNAFHCQSETRPLLLKSGKEDTVAARNAYAEAYFSCMASQMNKLSMKLSWAVRTNAMLACSLKEGKEDKASADVCVQKALSEFEKHRSLQDQPFEK